MWFKNSVFRIDVNTKDWLKATAVRIIKTMAQTAIATIGASATMGDVQWGVVGSATMLAGILSGLTCIAGLPEVKASDNALTKEEDNNG